MQIRCQRGGAPLVRIGTVSYVVQRLSQKELAELQLRRL